MCWMCEVRIGIGVRENVLEPVLFRLLKINAGEWRFLVERKIFVVVTNGSGILSKQCAIYSVVATDE